MITVSLCAIIFFSCKKEASLNNQSDKNVSVSTNKVNTYTLDLKPGPNDGQDVYVAWKANDPLYANSNYNAVAEMNPAAWTQDGALVKQRIFVKFTGLSAIPKSAKIVSAKLYLYGLSSSLNHPQGNSYYLGSGNNQLNNCVITRVETTKNWDESTLTWNTQPPYSTLDAVVFGPSASQWNWDVVSDVTKLVAAIVKYPAYSQGFAIAIEKESKYRAMVFATSEAADVNDRPRLVVEYNN